VYDALAVPKQAAKLLFPQHSSNTKVPKSVACNIVTTLTSWPFVATIYDFVRVAQSGDLGHGIRTVDCRWVGFGFGFNIGWFGK